jgi:hypothetical protein
MGIYFNTKQRETYLREYCLTWVNSCVKAQMYTIISQKRGPVDFISSSLTSPLYRITNVLYVINGARKESY